MPWLKDFTVRKEQEFLSTAGGAVHIQLLFLGEHSVPERKRPLYYSLLAAVFVVGFFALLLHSFKSLDYDWDFTVLGPFLWQSETHTPGLLLQG